MQKALESMVLKVVFESATKILPALDSQPILLKSKSTRLADTVRRLSHSGAIQKLQRGPASIYNTRRSVGGRAKIHDAIMSNQELP